MVTRQVAQATTATPNHGQFAEPQLERTRPNARMNPPRLAGRNRLGSPLSANRLREPGFHQALARRVSENKIDEGVEHVVVEAGKDLDERRQRRAPGPGL